MSSREVTVHSYAAARGSKARSESASHMAGTNISFPAPTVCWPYWPRDEAMPTTSTLSKSDLGGRAFGADTRWIRRFWSNLGPRMHLRCPIRLFFFNPTHRGTAMVFDYVAGALMPHVTDGPSRSRTNGTRSIVGAHLYVGNIFVRKWSSPSREK